MSRRPSQAELARPFRQSLHPDPAKQRETKRLHKARIEALRKRRDLKKEWYGRTGLDALNRRHARLLEEKPGSERDLMELMIGPGGGGGGHAAPAAGNRRGGVSGPAAPARR